MNALSKFTRIAPSNARIAVVGSINMDLVVRTARIPTPGETVLGDAFYTIPGGKGANQAVAMAVTQLGAQPAIPSWKEVNALLKEHNP